MKNFLLAVVAVAVVIGGGAFYGGMKYAQAKKSIGFSNLTPEQRQQFTANAGSGFRSGPGGRGGMLGGFISGEILSKDDKSITIKMRDGGSKIVFYSDKTGVEKFVAGAISDLEAGKNISVTGTPNQDGSITANSIQIRPVMNMQMQSSK